MAATTQGTTAVDDSLIKALSHPQRARALAHFNERVLSTKEIAALMDVPMNAIAYHVRTLRELGLIEAVGTRPVRGAIETFYRGVSRCFLSDENWSHLSPEAKEGFSTENIRMAAQRWREALDGGSFDARDDRHISVTDFRLDGEGWGELTGLLADALASAIEIQSASDERRRASGEDAIPACAILSGFESPAS